jgi:hypothetical protein
MVRAEVTIGRGLVVFRDEQTAVNALASVLPSHKGLKKELRALVRETREPTREEKQARREFGDIYVTLQKQRVYYANLETDERPRTDLFRRMREQNPSVEQAVLSGRVLVPVATVQQAAEVIDEVFATLPRVQDIPIPEYYLNPPPETDAQGRLVQQVNRFRITRGGTGEQYAPSLFAGKAGMYQTEHGLTTFLTSSGQQTDAKGRTLAISVLNVKNPLLGRPQPLQEHQISFVEQRLVQLQAQLAKY